MSETPQRAFVRVLIRDQEGRILVVSHKKSGERAFNLPGGKVEAGEAPATAARREVLEETNIVLRSLKLLYEDYFSLDATCWRGYFYEAEPLENEPHNMERHKLSAVRFVDLPLAHARGNKAFLVSVLQRWTPELADSVECQKRLDL